MSNNIVIFPQGESLRKTKIRTSKFFLNIKSYLRWYVLVCLTISSLVLWLVVFHEDRNGVLTFVVLDIGQGDSFFIESPTGTQVLVDGGPDKNLIKQI